MKTTTKAWRHELEGFLDEARSELWLHLRAWKRANPYGNCPLPELYCDVAYGLGLSIGQFHDCLRAMVRAGQVRLHPFTGAAFHLQGEEYGLMAGQELKFYAEPL